MNKKFPLLAAAAVATALPTAAFAAMLATAVTDLNVRSGPGPEDPVIGFLPISFNPVGGQPGHHLRAPSGRGRADRHV